MLPTNEEKATYVKDMFARIATGYDRTNRVMTFGQDLSWRQDIVDHVAPPVDGFVLDIGSGTGDFLPLLARWTPHGRVIGLDSCIPMMHEGYAKVDSVCNEYQAIASTAGMSIPETRCVISFVGGDALHLPFPDACFDAITTGFTIRNVTDIAAAFREMWRVCAYGGVVACLEVSHPRNPLIRFMHRVYFTSVVPLIGELMSGDREAYVYLQQSARAFPPPDTLAHMMAEAGWKHVQYQFRSLGAVALHVGVKI